MRRGRLATPGAFVPIPSVRSVAEIEDWSCALCQHSDELAWVHPATMRLVCRICLVDPWADAGEAGRRAAERLTALEVGIY
jgi:hypothetical protein